MIWLYQCLDIILTVVETLGWCIVSMCLCKEPRFSSFAYKFIMPSIYIVNTYILTWFSGLGAYKMVIVFIIGIVFLKLFYKDMLYQCITVNEFSFIMVIIFTESIISLAGKLIYGDGMLVRIGNLTFVRWETYVAVLFIRIAIIYVIYRACKNFQYKIQIKDSIVLTASFLPGFAAGILDCYNFFNLGKISGQLLYASCTLFSVLFLLVFLYAKNTLYLKEQEQQDKIQIARLRQQFTYYQEKFKDEERIRSVYHDMKNHLLILEQQVKLPETAGIIEKLQQEIMMYEDYLHTGNNILDIILKEKAGIAREGQIDFSVMADLSSAGFIEPLDISTIFGNALDNAIEASMELPPGQRVIIVKAGKVQDFFSVLVENNCIKKNNAAIKRTSKKDDFFHGFGISNMKKATGKYGGQLVTKCENGKFILKILIPIIKPAKL